MPASKTKLNTQFTPHIDGENDSNATDEGSAQKCINIGELSIDTANKEAKINGANVQLTPSEKLLLWLFALNLNDVLDRDFISENVFNRPYMSEDRIIDVCIHRLKQKLENYSGNFGRIVSKRGVGYVYQYDLSD